jgi:hypothetical protein
MSFGTPTIHTEEPRVLSLRVSQSAYGGTRPRVWGTCRIPGNLLDYLGLTPIPHTTSTSSGGGKGMGSIESTNTSYTYTAGLILGLCAGPIAGVGRVWKDKDITTLADLGLTLKTGALGQTPWPHLSASVPHHAVSYSGTAYLAASAFDLGSNPSSPSLNFEVQGERILNGGQDAAPADIIADICTDPVEGVALDAGILADTADYALWCAAKGFTLSLPATAQKPARDWLADILKATLAEPIWSAGKIKLVPYGDEPVGAWSPVTTACFALTTADLLSPPDPNRTQPADAVNRVTLTYTDRSADYNTASLTRDDLALVTQYGPRPESLDLPAIHNAAMAAHVCEFWRDRKSYIRNTWSISVDERYCRVEPMDLGTISYGPHAMDAVAVRVKEVTDHGDGKITWLVEEWPYGLLKPSAVATQVSTGYVPQSNLAPGATHTPVIFEAPNYLTAPDLQVWIGASGGPNWGGCNVWVSDDGDSYQMIGRISNPSRHGTLYTALAAGSDPDTTHTAYVDMSASGGQLLSGTQADADNGNTLCWLDGEVISYATAALVSTDRYALTYLRRGQSGTVSAGHSMGAKFLRLDGSVFRYRVPAERIGSPVWIKLQSFNQYGRSPEPLDTVTPYQYTLAGNQPQPITSLAATGGLYEVGLTWSLPDMPGIDSVEIFGATTNDRSVAYPLTTQKHRVTRWKHPGLQPAQTWHYWARVLDTSGNTSAFFPSSASGGVSAAPSSDPSLLLEQLQGSLGMDQLAAELAAPIELIDTLDATYGLTSTIALINTAGPADTPHGLLTRIRTQDTALRILDRAADTLAESITRATSSIDQHDRLIRGAGIYVDEVDGTVKIETYDRIAERVSSAEVAIDGVAASISLKASFNYVDEQIALAVLDPSQIADMSGLSARMTSAELNIDGLAAAVTLSATHVDLTNAVGRITTAEADIDALQGEVTLKASNADLGTLTGRVSTAETTLSALDVPAITQTVSDVRYLARDRDTDAEALLRAILTGEQVRTQAEVALAYARQEITAHVDDGLAAEAAARLTLAAQVTGNAAAIQTEQTARADADTALASSISTLSSQVNHASTGLPATLAAVQTEATTRADADTALASSITTVQASATSAAAAALAAQGTADDAVAAAATNAAAIQTEQTARADADTALASSITTVQARLDTGDFADVKTTATATADALGNVEAQWGVQVQAMADGTRAVAGIQLLAGSDDESVFAVLADKLLIYKPDGTGTPKQIVTLGTVNGETALGLDGNLIVDGSVLARHLSVESLSVVAGRIGGTLRSATSGARMELSDNAIRVYDDAGTLRVLIGELD